jgi:hypothetical protein
MKRHTQNAEELLGRLTALDTVWKDERAQQIIDYLDQIEEKDHYNRADLKRLLEVDFDLALVIFQLFLERSKDEFTAELKAALTDLSGTGKKAYWDHPDRYVALLDHLLVREAIAKTVTREYTWRDIMVERLKLGRGSAIKGQYRGRALEDFTESVVSEVFADAYDKRCSFTSRTGQSTEKADFAIPSKETPHVLIEVKAYGATGSKQTDVLGDIRRIIEQKRPDVWFLLVTDGVTWKSRASDFAKLVQHQNDGDIYRIYTKSMRQELRDDLAALKQEQGL